MFSGKSSIGDLLGLEKDTGQQIASMTTSFFDTASPDPCPHSFSTYDARSPTAPCTVHCLLYTALKIPPEKKLAERSGFDGMEIRPLADVETQGEKSAQREPDAES